MSDVAKEALFGELERVHKELAFQHDIGNACESWEIDVLGILLKHKGNLWTAESELREQIKRAKSYGFYQGMIHEVRETVTKLGIPDEERLLYERGFLGLVETPPNY